MSNIFGNAKSSMTGVFLCGLIAISIYISKSAAQTGAITLDHVVGRIGLSDSISCARPIEFVMRMTNNTPGYVVGVLNYFILYSPENANWSPPFNRWNPVFYYLYLDGGTDPLWVNRDGIGVDTLGFGAFALFEEGVPPSFSAEAFYISTLFDCTEQGKSI